MIIMNPLCLLNLDDYQFRYGAEKIEFPSSFKNICITALHTAIPYIHSFLNGLWFGWEDKKDIVTAICPAGHVAIQIIKISTEEIMVICNEHQNSKCPRHQDQIELKVNPNDNCLKVIDAFFPYSLYLSDIRDQNLEIWIPEGHFSFHVGFKKFTKRLDKTITPCNVEENYIKTFSSLKVVGMERSCAYHRKLEPIFIQKMTPKGICTLLYHSLYPYFLSLLYGGDETTKEFNCPHGNQVKIKLIRKKKRLFPILKGIQYLTRLVGLNLDVILFQIKGIITKDSATCPLKLHKNQEFIFGCKNQLCNSTFDTLIPLFFVKRRKKGVFFCTSELCKIQYSIGK